jgi:hypothetical protein
MYSIFLPVIVNLIQDKTYMQIPEIMNLFRAANLIDKVNYRLI